ncbi:MAG: hypothetical protein ACT4QC_00970 [Planctomycetaceae bacterium]
MDIRRIEVVDDAIAEILRRKTPAERLAMAFDCNRTVRLRLKGHLRSVHPDWTDAQIAAEVARRVLRGAG